MANTHRGTPRADRMAVLVVRLGDERLALPLDVATEILPAVATTPLPDAPAVVCGVANLHGEPLPVLSLRERLGLPHLSPRPEHHIVVCELDGRRLGLWVDSAEAVATLDRREVVPAADVASTRHLQGVAILPDGLILVYDVRSFLAVDEALALDTAMGLAGSRSP